MKRYLAILIAVLAPACTAPDSAKVALEKAGFTEIQTGGFAFFKCGDGDVTATEFTARNPAGAVVSGAVCGGYGKGYTIRF